MTTKRKFYRQVFHVEVLADAPIDMSGLICELVEGAQDYSIRVREDDEERVDGLTMAKLLISQESDPGFFGLTDDGDNE